MSDGEIEVSVRADGVDDAAGEIGGDGGGSGGGGGGRQQRGGGGGRGGMGALGKLLVRIAALLAFLGPILDVVGVITKIMTAFVAPLAVVLLRILGPTLRFLLMVLPLWFEFVALLDSAVQSFDQLRKKIIAKLLDLLGIENPLDMIRDGVDSVKERLGDARDWLGDILDTLRNLPSNIADRLPSAGDVGSSAREGIGNALLGGDDSRRRQAVNIGIEGGLEPFIDTVTRDGSVDFP